MFGVHRHTGLIALKADVNVLQVHLINLIKHAFLALCHSTGMILLKVAKHVSLLPTILEEINVNAQFRLPFGMISRRNVYNVQISRYGMAKIV